MRMIERSLKLLHAAIQPLSCARPWWFRLSVHSRTMCASIMFDFVLEYPLFVIFDLLLGMRCYGLREVRRIELFVCQVRRDVMFLFVRLIEDEAKLCRYPHLRMHDVRCSSVSFMQHFKIILHKVIPRTPRCQDLFIHCCRLLIISQFTAVHRAKHV